MPKFPSWSEFKEQQNFDNAVQTEDTNYLYDSYKDNQSGETTPQTPSVETEDTKNKETPDTNKQEPQYSVQDEAQQANGGQSYVQTAVQNVAGQQPEANQQEQKLGILDKPEVKTTPEREALIQEYNNLGNPNYLHTKAERDEYLQKHDELLGKLRAIDEELGNGAMDYNFRDRSQSVIGSAIKGYGADVANSAATALTGLNELGQKLGGDTGQYAGWATDEVSRAAIPMENNPDAYAQQRQEVSNIQAASDRLAQESAEDVSRAKNGQSKLAQFGTDIATNAIQMGIDTLAAGLTGGGSALAPMFVRSAGGGAREARQEGASTAQQLAYGAVRGGIEVATEKMFDGLAKVYGAGFADEAVERLIGKLGQGNEAVQTGLRWMFSGIGEAAEEGASGLSEPLTKMIYQGTEALKEYKDPEYWAENMYGMLVGYAMGGAGGAVNIVNGQNAQSNAEIRENVQQANEIQNALVNNGMNESDAKRASEILAQIARGESISKSQAAFLDSVQQANGIDTSKPDASAPQADTPQAEVKPAEDTTESEIKPEEQPTPETAPEQPVSAPAAESPTIPESPQENVETPSDELNSEQEENSQQQEEETAESGTTEQAEESETQAEGETTAEESATEEDTTAGTESESTTEETGERIPPRPPQQPTGQSTSSDYSELGEDYGTMEQGEKAERESNTPKRTAPGTKVSQSVRTVQEAKATPESRLKDVQSAVAEGKTSFVPVSNSERATNAETKIKEKGWSSALKDWTAAVRSGQANADLVAEGAVLLNNAANNPECTGAEYIDLMLDYVRLNRTMGQGLQAARILKTLSPEGKLYAFQKVVQNMNEQAESKSNGSKKGKAKTSSTSEASDAATQLQDSTGNKYTIPEELIEEYRQQTTDEGRDEVLDKMQQAIADQIPSTLKDKFTAIRYLNMLGNLKTQVRNIAGNVGMAVVQKVKNTVRSVAETIYSALKGGKYEKQYSTFYGRDLKRAARNDFKSNDAVQKEAMGERKFSSVTSEYANEIEEKRNVWKFGDNKLTRALGIDGKQGPLGKALSLYEKATDKLMNDIGDKIFVAQNYTDALAGYLKAHKITADQWTSLVAEAESDPSSEAAETVDKARQFAIKQAQEATFRDTNAISEFAQNFDKNWKGAKLISQGIMPFRKTPANVGVRMEEYSPLGFINATVKTIQAAKGKGNVTGTDVVDSLSKALTGTGLAYVGFALAAAGKARTKSDDDKQEAFDKLRGLQDYSITVNGTNYTLDWATPAAASIFMGVEAYNLFEDGDITGDELLKIMGNLTSPMLEMSMLSGLNDALNNISSFNDDSDALPQFILNSAWSYLTQGFTNTLLGQLEQASEDYRQTYYTDPENPFIPTSVQRDLAKAGNKTPGVDYQSADYIDAWGRKQANYDNPLFRYAYALTSPAYISDLGKNATAVDGELQRLYEAGKDVDGFPNVLPKQVSRNTEVNGKRLTADEYEKYATTKGQESLRLITELTNSSLYKNLDDKAKAEAINDCYEYAKYLADDAISKSRKEENKNDTYANLMTGVDKSGTQYDKTPLNQSNFAKYTAIKAGFDSAVKNGDYKAIDKIVSEYGKQNNNLKTVLSERNPTLRALGNWKNAGLNSKEYYDIQKELVKSQQKLDKSQKTGSVVELDALANSNLPESTKKRLIDSLPDYGSKTVKGVYDILYDYGFNSKQINDFWNQSQDWVYKDTGAGQSSQKQGTLQPLEAAYAISQLPDLTDAQRSDIYNKMKAVANVPYAINDWKNYTYGSEINYLASGKSKQAFGKSTASTPSSTPSTNQKSPGFTNSKFMKGK